MAVTDPLTHTSKKSKHKTSKSESVSNSPKKRETQSHRRVSASEEQDDSETDLDKPLFKIQSRGKFVQHTKNIFTSQTANGEMSDSETDIDKPIKHSGSIKPMTRAQGRDSRHHTHSVGNEPVRHDNDGGGDNDDEPNSMSLLQVHSAKSSPEKRSQQGSQSTRKSSKNSFANGAPQRKVSRRPNVPEMSSSEESESDSASETKPRSQPQHQSQSQRQSRPQHQSQPQSQSQLHHQSQHQSQTQADMDSEDESEPGDFIPATNPSEMVKQGLLQRTNGTLQGKGSQKTRVPEESSSEESASDSDSEVPPQSQSRHKSPSQHPHHSRSQRHSQLRQSQPQGQSQSQAESESISNLNPPVTVKQEVLSQSDSSSYEEEEEEVEEEEEEEEQQQQEEEEDRQNKVAEMQYSSFSEQFQEAPQQSLQRDKPPKKGIQDSQSSRQFAAISTFEQEHTPVSARVVDLPPDSNVWLLQVPRSVRAADLKGQHFPETLKGGEVWDLPTGRWQILDQPHDTSKCSINCLVSTGDLCYGMRWFEPKAFWFLKRIPVSVSMSTEEMSYQNEVAPLPIKELLKMKTNKAHLKMKHSRKRAQDSSPDLPSKRSKTAKSESDTSLPSPKKKKKKKKKHDSESNYADVESSVLVTEAGRGKKRMHCPETDEISPSKKRKKTMESGEANVHNTLSVSDVSKDDTSFSKTNKKKKKHKEKGDEQEFSSPVHQVIIKQEQTTKESELRELSHIVPQQQENHSRKKHKHKSHNKQETVTGDSYVETEHNDSRENDGKMKKKKQREDESVELDQSFRKKKKKKDIKVELPSSTFKEEPKKHTSKEKKKHLQESETSVNESETVIEKKKKKSKHQEKEADVEFPEQDAEKDNDADSSFKKKKKKHKHKDSIGPKVKKEKDFWERETSPEFLSRLYLTQIAPDDQ